MNIVETCAFDWPTGFERLPQDEWARQPVSTEGVRYAELTAQRWYANLDPTIREIKKQLDDGDLVVDYSAGTGILAERWLSEAQDEVGWFLVDTSPRFLRVAIERLGPNRLVAFRLLQQVVGQRRFQFLDEIMPKSVVGCGVDAVVSTNAVHLYADLADAFAGWTRVLRRGGKVFVQSGNILNPDAATGAWIIHDTVEAIQRFAARRVREDPRYARYRSALDDAPRMAAHDALRRKYFLFPRIAEEYCDALRLAGLEVERVVARPVEVVTAEWATSLDIYAEGILGWIGGMEKVEGRGAGEEDRRARSELIRLGLEDYFGGRTKTQASWTYITCRKP